MSGGTDTTLILERVSVLSTKISGPFAKQTTLAIDGGKMKRLILKIATRIVLRRLRELCGDRGEAYLGAFSIRGEELYCLDVVRGDYKPSHASSRDDIVYSFQTW